MDIPYTPVSNLVLRDSMLSLAAKGLYTILRSYAGLKDFRLTKNRLKSTFSGSSYQLDQAWKELKDAGYLQHFYSTTKNGEFIHVYDLHRERQLVPEVMTYAPNQTRSHGDLRFVACESETDYTKIPNDIARDSKFSLKLKGLYSVLSYLFKIPNFHFSLSSLDALCKEKAKALQTVWTSLKQSGLFKQHRHPTGEHNKFRYTYELLMEPNSEQPYFTNHRADGTITSSLFAEPQMISNEKSRAKFKNTHIIFPSLRVNSDKSTPSIPRIQRYPISAQVDRALSALYQNKRMRLHGNIIPLEDRRKAVEAFTPKLLEQFELSFKLPAQIKKPIPYIAAGLYQFIQKSHAPVYCTPADTLEDSAPFTETEMDYIIQTTKYRVKQAIAAGTEPHAKDIELTNAYAALQAAHMSMQPTDFEHQLQQLFQVWKNS